MNGESEGLEPLHEAGQGPETGQGPVDGTGHGTQADDQGSETGADLVDATDRRALMRWVIGQCPGLTQEEIGDELIWLRAPVCSQVLARWLDEDFHQGLIARMQRGERLACYWNGPREEPAGWKNHARTRMREMIKGAGPDGIPVRSLHQHLLAGLGTGMHQGPARGTMLRWLHYDEAAGLLTVMDRTAGGRARVVWKAAEPGHRIPDGDPLRHERGRLVREAWVEAARTFGGASPSWLIPWEQLDPADPGDAFQIEADCRIGEKVAAAERTRIIALLTALARGRHEYARTAHGSGLSFSLEREALTIESVISVIEDPSKLAGLMPLWQPEKPSEARSDQPGDVIIVSEIPPVATGGTGTTGPLQPQAGVACIDMAGHNHPGRTLKITTDAGVIHLSPDLVRHATGQRVLEMNIEPNMSRLSVGRTDAGGHWDTEMHQRHGTRTDVRLVQDMSVAGASKYTAGPADYEIDTSLVSGPVSMSVGTLRPGERLTVRNTGDGDIVAGTGPVIPPGSEHVFTGEAPGAGSGEGTMP